MKTNKSSPLVSVICICYNHEQFIESSLNSIRDQTYKNIEIIIIDDHSQDNSKAVIKKWISQNKVKLFITNNQNLGNVQSFNKALKTAKGKYIIDFATDDILLPKYIEKQTNNLENSKHKNPAVSFCNVEEVDINNKHLSYNFPVNNQLKAKNSPPQGYVYEDIVKGYFINAAGMMMSFESLQKLNGYDNSLAYEDLDYLVRASRLYPMIYHDEVLVKKRILPSSMTSFLTKRFNKKSYRMRNTTYIICKKIHSYNTILNEDLALLKRIYGEIKLNLKSIQITTTCKYFFLTLKILLRIPSMLKKHPRKMTSFCKQQCFSKHKN